MFYDTYVTDTEFKFLEKYVIYIYIYINKAHFNFFITVSISQSFPLHINASLYNFYLLDESAQVEARHTVYVRPMIFDVTLCYLILYIINGIFYYYCFYITLLLLLLLLIIYIYI